MARQVYQLQELDLELESNEQTLLRLTGSLGETPELAQARAELMVQQQQLDELRKQLRTTENEIKDLESKLTAGEKELYSGRIRNPKELANLQTDMEGIKAKKSQFEDRALNMMDQSEQTVVKVEALRRKVEAMEADWGKAQEQLTAEIETVKRVLARLENERRLLVAPVSQQIMELYLTLKKQKKLAVARVEKGTCSGCRISLPVTDLQRVRSGRIIQCSSCGRILYLD